MIKIGLEVHCALSRTKTKLFCGCANKTAEEPNTLTCPTCLGMPGSKPRVNAEAVKAAIKIGLALNCAFPDETFFSRKQYFYNDLPKNFQISQYEIPLASNGHFMLGSRKIGITRVHIEEDPGRVLHIGGDITTATYTLIDYNRSGVPLAEIVTEPDLRSAEEARRFLEELSKMLEYLEIYDSHREGALRVDTNVSAGGERVEVKNVTSFKDVEKVVEHEIRRQQGMLKKGRPVMRETRAWDGSATKSLRSKEDEQDYGYIFEPDLTKIVLDKKGISNIKLPEMAPVKIKRYRKEYGISTGTAEAIASDVHLAGMFEEVSKDMNPKLAGSWFAVQIPKTLNYINTTAKHSKLKAAHIVKLLKLVEQKKITERVAEDALRKLVVDPQDPEKLVQGMSRIFDEKTIEKEINEALASHPKAVLDYKSGRQDALNFLIGQVMRKTKGRGDPDTIRKIMKRKL